MESQNTSQPVVQPVKDKRDATVEASKLLIIAYTQTLSSLHGSYLQLKGDESKEVDAKIVRKAINRINKDIDALKESLPDKQF